MIQVRGKGWMRAKDLDSQQDPAETDRIVADKRLQLRLCPRHGTVLVTAPVVHVNWSAPMKCPDIGCDYRRFC